MITRIWTNAILDPPEKGIRVEGYGVGWSSVAQCVRVDDGWRTWFGADVTRLPPDVWRDLAEGVRRRKLDPPPRSPRHERSHP